MGVANAAGLVFAIGLLVYLVWALVAPDRLG